MKVQLKVWLIRAIFMLSAVPFLLQAQNTPDWAAPKEADLLTNPLKGNADAIKEGKTLYTTYCAACHGDDGAGNADIGAPRIAGQSDWYILRSLETFHSGARGFDEDDASGQQMRMALEAVDPSEFESIAAYAASMEAK